MAKLSCTLSDAYGRTTKRIYGMETQVLLADYVASAEAFATALEAVTDLALDRADLIVPIGAAPFSVTAGANVDVGGTASGYIEGGLGKKASMKIPGVKASLVAADGSIAVTGVVATWLASFEDAADFNLSDGEQISSWIRASLDR